jgi:hypothetical protein
MILIVEEAWRSREELRLLNGLHIWEVKVAPGAPKTPRDRVIRARRQLRCVVRAESEAKVAGVELGIVGAVGARPDAAEAGRPAAAWRHPNDEEALAWRCWRVEKKIRDAGAWRRRSGGKVPGGWSARASSPL